MKQVEVTIMGMGYRLACPDGGESTLAAAVTAVDREMTAIRDSGKLRARERIAVLAALNLAYQLADRPPAAALPDGEPLPDAPRIAALIARIDDALGADGQLL